MQQVSKKFAWQRTFSDKQKEEQEISFFSNPDIQLLVDVIILPNQPKTCKLETVHTVNAEWCISETLL